MQFEIPKCPECSEPPKGTLETVTGLALLMPADIDNPGDEFEYDGETKVFWDEQKTATDKDNRATLICPNGHNWQSGINFEEEKPTIQKQVAPKHTPGPWEVHNNIGKKSEIGVVAESTPCIIAVMGNQKQWPVESAANARLIAAAPALLEALKNTANELQHWHGWRLQTSPDYAGSDGFRICAGRIERAEAAIRQAEGEV